MREVFVVEAIHIDYGTKRPATWGPFMTFHEAERCCANLASNPRIVQARITNPKETHPADKEWLSQLLKKRPQKEEATN